MYSVVVEVQGTAPLMQHRYPLPVFGAPKPKKVTGQPNYDQEWREYIYANAQGEIFQPATHFDGALVKAAAAFKIQGKRGASYKELFKASVFCTPDEILHGVKVPEELDADGDKPLYVDMRPVVVQRNRVVRLRPCFKPGWKLSFEIMVNDDQIPAEVVNEALALAGRTVGIGDFRPRFGRFMVTKFEVKK